MGVKLVRDKIGDVEWPYPDSKAALRPPKSRHEHYWLLRQKLLEEAAELIIAENEEDILEELADVLAVLYGIADFHGIEWETVHYVERGKAARVGDFTRGLVWDVQR